VRKECSRHPIRLDPRHLSAEIGFFSVLHTWSQKLTAHPQVHCVVPAGGLSHDHTRWVRSRDNYFLPKQVLAEVFRGKFVDALKEAFQNGRLHFHGTLFDTKRPSTQTTPYATSYSLSLGVPARVNDFETGVREI